MRTLITAALLGIATVACEPAERPAFRAEVCLQLSHHGIVPTDATVYHAPADDFPGYGPDMLARFERSALMGPSGRVCFDGLNTGPHWFAAEGWDDFIADSVRGSKYVEITTREDAYEFELQVSEQH